MRRQVDRRRRVLAHANWEMDLSVAGRRRTEQMRQARRPSAGYAQRVRRRLRARWYSVVPVSRRSMAGLAVALSTATVGLIVAHWLSVSWTPLVSRPALAAPLRIDASESFGRLFMVAGLVATSAAAFLVYQLRRYRLDDYRGRYRVWRMVVVVAAVAAVHVHVDLAAWLGACVEIVFGQRIGLSGSDWIRMAGGIGLIVVAMHYIVETRCSRWAWGCAAAASMAIAASESVHWNLWKIETPNAWVLWSSLPLVAVLGSMLSVVGFLRHAFREVRGIEDHWNDGLTMPTWSRPDDAPEVDPHETTPAQTSSKRDKDLTEVVGTSNNPAKRSRFARQRAERPSSTRRGSNAATEQDTSDHDDEGPTPKKRRWWQRSERPADAAEPDRELDIEPDDASETDQPIATGDAADTATAARAKRRFSMRRRPTRVEATDAASQADADEIDDSEAIASGDGKAKRGWFRRRPSSDQTDGSASAVDGLSVEAEPSGGEDETDMERPKRKRWFGRSKAKPKDSADPSEADVMDDASQAATQTESTDAPEFEAMSDEESDIDWSSMSKSERRRMRKQLKRQQRAA